MTKGAILAIASGDPGEKYYLLKKTGNGPENLKKRLKDGWGMCFPEGANSLRGHFYVKQEETLSLHFDFLEKGKVAVVYTDLQCHFKNIREVIKVSEQLHLDILQSVNEF